MEFQVMSIKDREYPELGDWVTLGSTTSVYIDITLLDDLEDIQSITGCESIEVDFEERLIWIID